MTRLFTLIMALALVSAGVACVPRKLGETEEVPRRADTVGSKAPVLPESNPPADLVVDALRYDLTVRPDDQNYWSFTRPEATCVADKIVAAVGPERLSQLGYRPGTPGAGLPDIALTPDERVRVMAAFDACVDMKEVIADLLFGKGRISSQSAMCVAKILDKAGLGSVFIRSWLFAEPVDAFADGGPLANTMSAAAQVCLNPKDLNWPTLRSPLDEENVIDADAPGGASGSNHPDDQRLREEKTN